VGIALIEEKLRGAENFGVFGAMHVIYQLLYYY
jgi:hypothetical protein